MALSITFTNALTAVLLIILGTVIAQILRKIVKRAIKKTELGPLLKRELNLKTEIEDKIANTIKYIIYTITIIIALTEVGIPSKALEWILIIILVLIVLFVLLAVKDWIPNMAAWLYLIKTQKIKRGETISVRGLEGVVTHIGLLETKVQTKEEIIFIPNLTLIKGEVRKK